MTEQMAKRGHLFDSGHDGLGHWKFIAPRRAAGE